MPNLASKLSPLYVLLSKKQKWEWSTAQEKAFQTAKEALQADSLLIHYDPSKSLVLACDASQCGIGAVLSHVTEDQQERPIAYASRTLTIAEKNYSQLEKEALAIIFAVKKFHNYILARHFEIESDHRPLSFLFSENKRVPQMASSRIQRWALTLASLFLQHSLQAWQASWECRCIKPPAPPCHNFSRILSRRPHPTDQSPFFHIGQHSQYQRMDFKGPSPLVYAPIGDVRLAR